MSVNLTNDTDEVQPAIYDPSMLSNQEHADASVKLVESDLDQSDGSHTHFIRIYDEPRLKTGQLVKHKQREWPNTKEENLGNWKSRKLVSFV